MEGVRYYYNLFWLVRSHSRARTLALAADKIGDLTKLEIVVQNESFWRIVGPQPIAAPRIGGRDNEAGEISVWAPSPLHIL